jgi:hypothetical protein
MAVATLSVVTPRRYRRAWIALILSLFFGLLSLVAVGELKVECGAVLLTGGGQPLTGGGKLLTAGQQCRLDISDELRIALPAWTWTIFR